MKTGVLAPIAVESLFEKRPNFSWVYKDQRKLYKNIEKWDFDKNLKQKAGSAPKNNEI
jgi:hypothetical protein